MRERFCEKLRGGIVDISKKYETKFNFLLIYARENKLAILQGFFYELCILYERKIGLFY